MEALAKYWKLVRLQASGEIAPVDRDSALQHLKVEYPEFAESPKDRPLQILLVRALRQTSLEAALCLRCFASHHILQGCQRLVFNYGEHYGLKLWDLAPLTLTDDGTLGIEITMRGEKLSIQRLAKYTNEQGDRFQPLAFRILEKFNPEKASLSTWAFRLTWQDSQVKKFLKDEFGILPISHWALLNDTKPATFQRILIKSFNFPDPDAVRDRPTDTLPEVKILVAILQAYHAVYVHDRRSALREEDFEAEEAIPVNRRGHRRGKLCPDPTVQQYQEMMELLDPAVRSALRAGAPDEVLEEKLLEIADYLRRHRLKQLPPREILDASQSQSLSAPQEVLVLFDRYLALAVAKTLKTRLESARMTPEQRHHLLRALHLQYQERQSQGEIAKMLGLGSQSTASRLLDFKKMKSGILLHMSERLKNDTPLLANYFDDPDRLLALQDWLEAYLQDLLNEDKRWLHTPNRQGFSQLALVVCQFLDSGV